MTAGETAESTNANKKLSIKGMFKKKLQHKAIVIASKIQGMIASLIELVPLLLRAILSKPNPARNKMMISAKVLSGADFNSSESLKNISGAFVDEKKKCANEGEKSIPVSM
jgi:hypothetical protein